MRILNNFFLFNIQYGRAWSDTRVVAEYLIFIIGWNRNYAYPQLVHIATPIPTVISVSSDRLLWTGVSCTNIDSTLPLPILSLSLSSSSNVSSYSVYIEFYKQFTLPLFPAPFLWVLFHPYSPPYFTLSHIQGEILIKRNFFFVPPSFVYQTTTLFVYFILCFLSRAFSSCLFIAKTRKDKKKTLRCHAHKIQT